MDTSEELRSLRARVAELELWKRRVVDSNLIAVYVCRSDGRIVEANDALARLLGYSRDELSEGRLRLSDLTPRSEWTADEQAQEEIERRGLCTPYEKHLRRSDGLLITVLAGGAALEERDANHIGFLVDVTKRKMAEEARDQSEERFRTLVRNVPGVVYLRRNDDRYSALFLNDAIQDVTGYPAVDFLEDRVCFVDVCHPDDFRDVTREIDAALARRRPFHLTYRFRHTDGKWLWIEDHGQGVFDNNGNLQFLEGTALDITARKEAEFALRAANDDLEQRVAKRTAEYSTAIAQLRREVSERRRVEGDLRAERALMQETLDQQEAERKLVAYEIHDGLAQYITGALMQFECCTRQAPPQTKERFDEGLRLLRMTIDEARRLISGLRPPVLDECGIVSAIEYLINEQGRQAGNVKFIRDVQFERLAPLLESALFRIVQEGLNNIAKHSGAGRAEVELVQIGDRLRLEIRDWGAGFDPSQITEKSYGLKGIRERARLLGGTAQIHGRHGRGTRVTVVLPLIEADDAP